MMNRNRCQRIILSMVSGSALLAGLALVLNGTPPLAHANNVDLFVSPTATGVACTQAQPCSLQTALNQTQDGDRVHVAAGRYTGAGGAVLSLTHSIELLGGWNGAPTGPVVHDRDAFPAILDGERERRVVYICRGITPTLDGFFITRGNATGLTADCAGPSGNPAGCGGGIFAYRAHPVIANNVITNNVAAIASLGFLTGTTGYGGGIYLRGASNAVVRGNRIISNAASIAYLGMGGGLLLHDTSTGLLVEGNQIIGNIGTTTSDTAWGGGIGGGPDGVLIAGNLLEGNRDNGASTGYGAGLFQWYGSAGYYGNVVVGNEGTHAVYLGHTGSRFEGNWVTGNAVNWGLQLQNGYNAGRATLVNNVIAQSGSQGTLAAYAYVGGPLTTALIHNTLVGTGGGDGVSIGGSYVTLSMVNTIVTSHTWGVTNTSPGSCTVTADYTLFWSNGADGIRGTNPVDGDPRFRSPPFGDYHLGAGSDAIDGAVDVGVAMDIDGQSRPHGAGCDIGADEAYQPPAAHAGVDQTVLTNTLVTLDGGGSFDPDGDDPLTYRWAQAGGPVVTLSSQTSASPTFTAPSDPAVLSFSLTVTDATGTASIPDQCVVTVWDGLCTALNELVIEGPVDGDAGVPYTFTAVIAPPEATLPIAFTWSPLPPSGQGTPTASYQWVAAGIHVISMTAENCGGSVVDTHPIAIRPAPPALNAISNPDGDGNYTVDWSDVPGAEFYMLEEDDSAAFSTPTTPYAGGESQASITDQPAGIWYYRVSAISSGGDSEWSTSQSVAVKPAAPTLYAIANPGGDPDYTVDWSDVSGATSYQLEEDDNSSFSSPATVFTGAESQVAISGQPAGTWYYRVRASNAGGDSPWSGTEWVAVKPAAPTLYAISNPSGGNDYTVDWSDVSGATSYELQEDGASNFPSPTTVFIGAESQHAIAGQPAGTWYYRVRASNAGGDSPWSAMQSTVAKAWVFLPLTLRVYP